MLRRVDVITIFPDLVERFLGESLVGSARERGLLELRAHDLREFAEDRRRTVDDAPYGGGPGMVMKPEPLLAAIESLAGERGPEREAREAKVILLTPQGKVLDQALLAESVETPHLVLVCGRYEGVDQRVIDLAVDEEVSIGDYVLCGGEVPAMVLIEGLARLVPGVLGNPESARQESFRGRLLEGPHYTRPPAFRGQSVPDVLLSGNHAAIASWREARAKALTRSRRPELLEEVAPEKVAPEKVAPEKVAPEKVAPEKVAPEKVAPEKVAPEKVAPEKTAVPRRETRDGLPDEPAE